jgi:ABC-type transporter Mla subunit MlaD
MFAERALFVTQKMPMLLRWQTELLSVNAVDMPAVRQLVTNSTQIAASVDRFARVAEQLPGQVSTEREEILKALQAQEKDVTSLMSSGTQFSASLNTTLTTLDALMKRFGVGETNSAGPPKTNAEPFRIQDYAQTAAQLEATARQLTELLVTLDQTLGSTNLLQLSAQVGPVVQQAQTGGKEIVDYVFWKGFLLVVIALLAALIYRFLVVRIIKPNSKSNSP